jgi:SAM-dependent MidA family methyltransferase
MGRLSRIVARQGGAILAIDYGYAKTQTGETLQAVKKHAYADPLEAPGQADLSAHVDFGTLGETAKAAGLVAHRVTPQGEFLKRLGIFERAEMLGKANPGQKAEIDAGLHRLTDGKEMGDLFKAFVAASPGLVPPGIIP